MSDEHTSISVLDRQHAEAFKQALARILSTKVAESTYAEILDGLPTIDSFREFHFWQEGHPIWELEHTSLCPGVLERTRAFREAFDPLQLTFPPSRFELRLLELLAVSCHQIAVYLFNLDDGVHKHRVYEAWRDIPRTRIEPGEYFAPAVFFHSWYVDFDQYPNGIADIVGYWAEAKIFGGVVIFDRGESGVEESRLKGPSTIFPPTPAQYDALINFLLGPAPGADESCCPIPIHATGQNRWRYDPWDSMTRFNIFRDRYGRKPPEGPKPHHCVQSAVDWPELGDRRLILMWQYEALRGNPLNQAAIDAAVERMKQITPSSPIWREGL
ncbi:hypothetical protein VTK56DRAFT_5110 [Thermocarpiscus australiensis]